jgi:hypothetical protein
MRLLNRLNNREIKNAKSREKDYRLSDERPLPGCHWQQGRAVAVVV